ncbi:hypothetical protein ACH5RR_012931 [Cinchona calisaya]|uniref:Uncharacterized protein n=1 Tax=Cinchona calisaya TaxID=153742 RepID=A0ABD2ZYP8_9GENT
MSEQLAKNKEWRDGKVAHIPDDKIIAAFHLDETLQTKADAESLCQELLMPLKKNPLELEKRYSFALREHPDIDSDGHTYLFSRSSAKKAIKRLFQMLTNLEELLFFWCASVNMVFPA